MKLFFRFNCGNMWGLGHLYRNITLIHKMTERGYDCVAVINDDVVARTMLSQERIRGCVVDEYESAHALIDRLNGEYGYGEKLLFWDRLRSEASYIKELMDSGIKLITYDDYDESALLASECILTKRISVGGEVPRHAGPGYQLLRDDIREYALKNKDILPGVSKILLHFGGTDPQNILSLCYHALNGLDGYLFEYIAGKEERPDIKAEIEKTCSATYDQGVTDFGKRLYEADVCLVAGGVSMYEASAIGTPMITISHNEGQNLSASIFEKEVGSINLGIAEGITVHKIRKAVLDLCLDYEKRRDMSAKMKRFVPPNGTEKVCDIIEAVAKEGEYER